MEHSILSVDYVPYNDTSISYAERHSHHPYANTTYGLNDEIRIPIQNQDAYTFPAESYIYIQGKVTDKAGAVHEDIQFVTNGLVHLFEEIRYEINGTVVDRVKNPGIATTMKGYASYDRNESIGLAMGGWEHTG